MSEQKNPEAQDEEFSVAPIEEHILKRLRQITPPTCKKCRKLKLPCETCGGLSSRAQTGLENCGAFELGLAKGSIKQSIFNKAALSGARVKHFLLKYRNVGAVALAEIAYYVGISHEELDHIPFYNVPAETVKRDQTLDTLREILTVLKSIDERLK